MPCDDAASASRHAELLLDRNDEYEEIEVFDGGDWRARARRDEDEQGAAAWLSGSTQHPVIPAGPRVADRRSSPG